MRKLIICISMMLALGVNNSSIYAETVKSGNKFTQVANKKSSGKEVKTEYIYEDSKGVEYPIYMSATGKVYIKRVSEKTGKGYKQYLPEVGKQLNPNAYKTSKTKK